MLNNLDNIILLGPLASGKSKVASSLSELSGFNNYPVDKLKWYYRFKNGYDIYQSSEILRNEGFEKLIKYAKNYFDVEDLNELLESFDGIIDLGATDTHCSSNREYLKLKMCLDKYSNTFLLLPSEDEEKSIRILEKRLRLRYANDEIKSKVIQSYLRMNKAFVRSESNKALARNIIYCGDLEPMQIAREILSKCEFKNGSRRISYLSRVS